MSLLPDSLQWLLSLFTVSGVGAACGFRVFLPWVLILGAHGQAWGDWIGILPHEPVWLGIVGCAAVIEMVSPRFRASLGLPGALAGGGLAGAASPGLFHTGLGWHTGLAVGGSVALIVGMGATRLRREGGGGGLGESLASLLLAGVAVYSPVVAPMVVVALLAGALKRPRRQRRRAT